MSRLARKVCLYTTARGPARPTYAKLTSFSPAPVCAGHPSRLLV
eukprot:COSAG05_NODE_1339_length_5145_cov_5.141102_6_plen_44_part_00